MNALPSIVEHSFYMSTNTDLYKIITLTPILKLTNEESPQVQNV